MPLRVCAGLNDPQEFTGVHDQFTSPVVSLVTIAVTSVLELTWTEAGGAGLKVTVIVGGVVPEPDPPPPHPTRAEIKHTPMSRSVHCLVVIPIPLFFCIIRHHSAVEFRG